MILIFFCSTLFQFTQLRKEFNYCCTLSQQLASSFGNGAAAHGHTTREPNPTMVSNRKAFRTLRERKNVT